MKKHLFLVAMLLSSGAISAQKIDFDFSSKPESQVLADGYVRWAVDLTASATQIFDGVTIKVEPSGEATILRSQWSKGDVVSKGLRLTGDGLASFIADAKNNTPMPTTQSMGMKFTISGLSAGKHTIQAYHNGVNGYTSVAPINIYVNGELVIENLQQSANAATIESAAFSYLTVNAEAGKDVVIEYRSNLVSGVTYGSSAAYVNGMIFDEVSAADKAQAPYPADQDYHTADNNGSVTLRFSASENAKKHVIYLGTDPNNLAKVSEQTDTIYTANNLSSLNTYYWRVDEVNSAGTTEGDVWSFRTRHLAFPGAEGYGKYAIGGRGGKVYHVTTLEDNGDDANPIEGSFRYGIKKVTGPRTIVFDVSGIISLKSRLTCSDPYVTIAGQTAPGNGIMFRTSPFGMASDGITRFIRMRLGHKALINNVIPKSEEDYGDKAKTAPEYIQSGFDGMGMAGNDNSIMDHCSISWTIDEAFSSRNSKSLTLQNTLISEALNQAGHPNYSAGTQHGYAATIGGGEMSDTLTVGSYHHNLLAHCEGRNWSLSGGLNATGYYDGHHDIFNNVVYNWGGRATDGGTHNGQFVSNFYKAGPAKSTSGSVILKAELEGTGRGTQEYYVNGNLYQNQNNGSLVEDAENTTYKYKLSEKQVLDWTVFVNKPYFESLANVESAKAAYKNVLSDVGANQPFFDPHDTRMVNETLAGTYSVTGSRSGKKGLPDSEEDNGCEGFDGLQMIEATRPADFDTDGDGMPDWWETATGNTDGNADSNNDGYTNLEDYLNWMAAPHFDKLDDIDLKAYFAGYNNNPSFAITSTTGNINASVEGTTLKVSADSKTANLATVTIKATDADGWGSLERTFNFAVCQATGIESIAANKEINNTDETVYDLQGRVVATSATTSLPKGIYIYKGKKYIIK